MSSRIVKDISFFAAVHFENQFLINLYECDMSMLVHTDDPREQRIAIDRLVYFVSNYLQNSIIVSGQDKTAIEKYEAAGMSTCIVPEEPFDQILGLVFLNKFNSIMEERCEITNMTFGSRLSDYIKFDVSKEEAEAMYPDTAWYNDSTVAIRDKPKKKKDKIVKLFDPDEWEKNELSWKEKKA